MTDVDWGWMKKSTRVKVRDPTDGMQILSDDTRAMLFNWCKDNCQGRYWIGMGYGEFELETDSILFRLTWT